MRMTIEMTCSMVGVWPDTHAVVMKDDAIVPVARVFVFVVSVRDLEELEELGKSFKVFVMVSGEKEEVPTHQLVKPLPVAIAAAASYIAKMKQPVVRPSHCVDAADDGSAHLVRIFEGTVAEPNDVVMVKVPVGYVNQSMLVIPFRYLLKVHSYSRKIHTTNPSQELERSLL